MQSVAMSYTGIMKGGVVVLPPGVQLPEGAQVEVTVSPQSDAPQSDRPVYDALAEFVGAFAGLPEDLARNHDHYLHGTPRR
jgi:hypothetical protein